MDIARDRQTEEKHEERRARGSLPSEHSTLLAPGSPQRSSAWKLSAVHGSGAGLISLHSPTAPPTSQKWVGWRSKHLVVEVTRSHPEVTSAA